MSKKNEIEYQGELDLNGLIIPCYVLKDSTRVLSTRGMQIALKMVNEGDKKMSGTRLDGHFNQKSLKPFFKEGGGQNRYEPLICYKGGTEIHGYEASVLVDICDAFLKARETIELSSRQSIIAHQCEILMRAFARVGITALVDEATGYQYDRERDELQKVLKQYISEELLPWQKTFPDTYYQELFRLNGWNFTIRDIRKKPSVIGSWTNTLVYKRLPNGVLEELKKNVPRSEKGNKTARFHQFLTSEIGKPNLRDQILKVITIFQISKNMDEMWSNFKKMNSNEDRRSELPFEFDDHV